MVILIAVILLCVSFLCDARATDWESSEFNAEQRHQELMELQRELNTSHKKQTASRVQQRRAIREPNGRILIEEVLVETMEGEV